MLRERRRIVYVSENIYGLGKVKLKIKWPGRLDKNTNLIENLK
jgi:hypothetical protein